MSTKVRLLKNGDVMSHFKQRTWHATDDSLVQLEKLSEDIGNANLSATIRFCIKQEFDRRFRQPQAKEAS